MGTRIVRVIKLGMVALAGLFVLSIFLGADRDASASDKSDAQSIVDKSRATFTDLVSDENYVWLRDYLKNAKAVLIFPQVLKGGFFLGGSGGTGVLLIRNDVTGNWSDPAFYTVGSVTFGLQFGGEAAEVIMVAESQKGVDSLLSSSVKLGGDVSVAIGPIGGGAKGAVSIPEVRADFVSFSRSKGLYGGLNLEGSVLQVRDSLNNAYYGKKVSPGDILLKKAGGEADADELRLVVEKATTR